MNTDLKEKANNDFENDFCKLMNNEAFEKTLGNVRKYRDIKHKRKKQKLISIRTKLSQYKVLHIKLIGNRNEKQQMIINKPVYLGLSILELRKIIMYKYKY